MTTLKTAQNLTACKESKEQTCLHFEIDGILYSIYGVEQKMPTGWIWDEKQEDDATIDLQSDDNFEFWPEDVTYFLNLNYANKDFLKSLEGEKLRK